MGGRFWCLACGVCAVVMVSLLGLNPNDIADAGTGGLRKDPVREVPLATLRGGFAMHRVSIVLAGLVSAWLVATPAAGAGDPPLSGRVTSAEEGRMEGVVVSAQKSGSPITISVVSDANGSYRFPGAKLGPGRYAI